MINHLWQTSCFVLAAGLLAFALRKSPPKVRYWIWLSASLKFLVPLTILMSLGSMLPQPTRRVMPVAVPISTTVLRIAEPFTPASNSRVPAQTAIHWASIAIGIVWALGFLVIAVVRCRSWLRIREALHTATPIELPIPIRAVVTSDAAEPGIVGFLWPVLVLPAGLVDHLNASQLHAVLAHEMCHVRRRDNLFAAIHMAVEAIFWFHPLVWWIGSRMVEERERACDEEVLQAGCEPADYVAGILNVCRLYRESPLSCVSGVTGADVKKRLRAILSGKIAREWSAGKKAALTAVGLATLAGPIVLGVLHAQPATPEFEVASIKLAAPGAQFMFGIRPLPGGRVNGTNVTLKLLIETAYSVQGFQLIGGQGWIETERYNIEATPDSRAGPNEWKEMLRNLLADRFQLVFHRETRDLPVYALLPARKDGRLGPGMVESKEGGCVARDPAKPLGPPGPGQPPFCGNVLGGASQLIATAATPGDIAPLLSRTTGRKVIDKTGLSGRYDITLKYTPDENQLAMMALPGLPPPRAPADTSGPSLFTALQEQLGLKLESQKAPVEIFVIDRAEKPSEN